MYGFQANTMERFEATTLHLYAQLLHCLTGIAWNFSRGFTVGRKPSNLFWIVWLSGLRHWKPVGWE